MCWLPTCKTSLIKKCRLNCTRWRRENKNIDDRNMRCVFSGVKFASLARVFILVQLLGTLQTNSPPSPLCLIKSSVLNVFVEGKGIFRAENTFADNSWPRYFPKDGCTHSSAHCVCVCWLRSEQIYFQVFFFFPSSLFSASCSVFFFLFFFTSCFELTNRNPGRIGN